MKRTSLWFIILVLATAFLGGCSRDPKVKRQKYLESGQRYYDSGKYKEAVIQFSNALRVDKNFADAHYRLGETFLKLGSAQNAYAELGRAVDLQPDNYKARISLANLLIGAREVDKAAEQVGVVLQAQPNNAEAHQARSAIAALQGNRDLAIAEITKAVELDPKNAAVHVTFARLLAAYSADPGSIENHLKKALELDPKSTDIKEIVASFYEKQQRWEEAELLLNSSVASDPYSVQPRVALADLYFRRGDTAKTEQILRQATSDLADDPAGAQLMADYYLRIGALDKALTEFATQSAAHPKYLVLKKSYADLLLETGQQQKAGEVIRTLVKDNARDPGVVLLNGISLVQSGKVKEAVTVLQALVKDSPENAKARYWLARAAEAEGDAALAEQNLREAVRIAPGMIAAEEELANIAIAKGDFNQLEEIAQKTIAVAPRSPLGYIWQGVVAGQRKNLPAAEQNFNKAVEIAPKSPLPYLRLGQFRIAQKRWADAERLLTHALELNPKNVETMQALTMVDIAQRQSAKAIARINAQIAKTPDVSGLYYLLAAVQNGQGDDSSAEGNLEKALKFDSQNLRAIHLYTRVELQLGKPTKAIPVWEQWVTSHPNDAMAYAVLGSLVEPSERNKAQTYYQKALQVDPNQSIAANNLAFLMLETGQNTDMALTLAQTARRLTPDSPKSADTLAWAYYYKGSYAMARTLLEGALKTAPNNAAYHYHLGMVCLKLADHNNASLHFKRVLTLVPNTPTAENAKKALGTIS